MGTRQAERTRVISGIVLAAGLSRRMGRSKLLLDWGGQPMIRQAVEQARTAGLEDLLVVVGPEETALRQALADLPVRFTVNPTPEAGQGSSIACGASALDPSAEAALIILGDQPALPSEVIPRLVETFRETAKPIVAPVYRGVQGNPVLFAASVFPELKGLTGDRGARAVVDRHPGRVERVPFDVPMPADLDTPEEYERLRPPGAPV
jgi:molybdenum cofactor cytidylyltransferase